MVGWIRATLLTLIVATIAVVPIVFYRASYAHHKRLREIRPGLVYRSGQMTVEGFSDAVRSLGIRTIVNLQEDYPDPDINFSFFDRRSMKESELCRQLGVRYVQISPDLVRARQCPPERPHAIEEMLKVFDDPNAYPVLIHCRAGLHRTGCMAGIYRMEYQGWSPMEAYEEMRKHGFGDSACTSANEYVRQYVLTYQPGIRLPVPTE